MTVLLPKQHKNQTIFLIEEILKTVAFVHMKQDDISAVRNHLAAMLQDKRDMTVQCDMATFENGKTQMILTIDFKEIVPPAGEKLSS